MSLSDKNPLITNAPSSVEEGRIGYGSTNNVPPAYAAKEREPPSYESLRDKIRETREQSESTCMFLWKIMVLVLCGTVGYVIIIGLMFVLPVAMIVMGGLYYHDCSAERYIPIYLIVMGTFCLFLAVLNGVQRCICTQGGGNEEERRDRLQPFEVLITCFLLGWFITGNIWIYRTYYHYQWTDKSASDYCDRTFYMFSFWITTSIYMLFASLCCCGMVASCISYCCLSDRHTSNRL